MLFIIEILFFIMGIYAVIAAKLPAWFVGKGFVAVGNPVRLLGLVMAAPLPLAFCAGFTLGIIDPELVTIASVFEFVAIIAAVIITLVALKKIRVPEGSSQTPE
jgi:hypothetical protein